MNRLIFVQLALLPVLFLGCGDGPKEKAVGVWKAEDERRTETPEFFEITETLMIHNGEADQALEIAIDERDGRAVIRKAGTDTAMMILSFADDGTATAEVEMFGTQRLKLIPSSGEEMRAALFPPPERLYGFWSRPVSVNGLEYHEVIEFAKEYIRADGQEEKAAISSAKGLYHFADSKLLPRTGRIKNDGTLVLSSGMGGRVMTRLTEEDARKFIAEKDALPDQVTGLWMLGSGKKPFDAPEFLELSRDGAVRMKGRAEERQPGSLTLKDGEFVMQGPDGAFLFTVKPDGAGAITLSTGGFRFSAEPTWTRVTPQARDEALAAYDALPQKITGIWRKANWRGDIKQNPFLEITPQVFRVRDRDETVTAMRGDGDVIVVDTQDKSYRLGIPDADSINLGADDWSLSGDYRRSSAEERDSFLADLKALPDKIIGHWRSTKTGDHDNFHALIINRDSFTWGGNTYQIAIRPENEKTFELVNAQTGGKYLTVSINDNGLLWFEPNEYSQRGNYVRSTAEECAALLEGKVPLPIVLAGHWIAEEQDGINMKYNTLFLGDGKIVRDGMEEPLRVEAGHYTIRLMRADAPNYEIANLEIDYDQPDQIRPDFHSSRRKSYRRATVDEYEKALATCRVGIDGLYGEWRSESMERGEHPQAIMTIVKGGEGEWPAMIMYAGRRRPDQEQVGGPIPGIFDIADEGRLILRGDKDLRTRLADITIVDANALEMQEYKLLREKLKFRKQ